MDPTKQRPLSRQRPRKKLRPLIKLRPRRKVKPGKPAQQLTIIIIYSSKHSNHEQPWTARRRHRFRHGSAPSTGIRRRLRTWTTRTIDLERYHPCSRTGNWPVFGAQEHSPGTLQHDWEGPGSPLRSQVSTSPSSHEPMEWVKCLGCTL